MAPGKNSKIFALALLPHNSLISMFKFGSIASYFSYVYSKSWAQADYAGIIFSIIGT